MHHPPTLTILYIDDDPAIRFLVEEVLAQGKQELGDEAEICLLGAGSVEEAGRQYGAVQPDALLLDYRLGGMDGWDALPGVKQTWHCPVWILTGMSSEWLRDRCVGSGAEGIISKDAMLQDVTQLRLFLLEHVAAPSGATGAKKA